MGRGLGLRVPKGVLNPTCSYHHTFGNVKESYLASLSSQTLICASPPPAASCRPSRLAGWLVATPPATPPCSDLVFTIAFTIEAALKILAFGFKPYMSYFQNVIDILIVVSSLVMVVLDTMADLSVVKVGVWVHACIRLSPRGGKGVSTAVYGGPAAVLVSTARWQVSTTFHGTNTCPPNLLLGQLPPSATPVLLPAAWVQGLRVLRAIKPLRALTRSAGMQQIFKSLTLSLAAMGNVSMVVLLFFLIFGILGVQVCGSTHQGLGSSADQTGTEDVGV